MKHHGLWMIIACALPLLLIFMLPSFGAGSNVSLFVFIVLCFGLHMLMMRGHDGKDNKDDNGKEAGHGTH
jgi:Flp pilus assembly protein TadB